MKYIKLIAKIIIFNYILIAFLILGSYFYTSLCPKLEIKNANNIVIYDKDNNAFFQGNNNTNWIPLSKISNHLINATISTEDKNFYEHHGFDVLRIIKALYINYTSGNNKQGASTITQQYVKNLFLSFEKNWKRKWNEMWLTMNVETHYTKDKILEGYLNTIYYGHGIYGIENASNYYFNKSASELTLAEASMLAGIPKAPSNYSPISNYGNAKLRQYYVLNTLFKNNYITYEEMETAYNEELHLYGQKTSSDLTTVMYFKDVVMNELEKIDSISPSLIETGGLKIFTTLDIFAQKTLEESINSNLTNDNIQAAGIMMNPQTGEILAMLGGRNYNYSQYNRAVSSKRQVGSTMKPLLYYAALENGFTSSTAFTSERTTFTFSNNSTYSPRNAGEIYGDMPISLAAAISYSENVYAVKTHLFLGQDILVNFAKKLGITANLIEIPSLPLGTIEINMLEMIKAYATFANEGYSITPHLIRKVEDSNGNILYEFNQEKELILNPSLVYILNELLTSTYDKTFINYNYPTLFNLSPRFSRKYAIKSGSTATDTWAIGYNKDIITSIWVGYDDATPLSLAEIGSSRIAWTDTMEKFLKNVESKWYTKPNNVVGVLVDPVTGTIANSKSKNKKILYYLKGTEPTTLPMEIK